MQTTRESAQRGRSAPSTLRVHECAPPLTHTHSQLALTLYAITSLPLPTPSRGAGTDQLADVISRLRSNPTDRRIVLTAWNPAALREMALPPCHMFAQFYVADGELSCQMYQRSGDMGLGVPFNIASYALLTRMLAQVAGLRPGEFIHVLGDAHVYKNHVEPLMEQLGREPRPFPKLTLDASIKEIDDFRMEHFSLTDYNPHAAIKMEMAV